MKFLLLPNALHEFVSSKGKEADHLKCDWFQKSYNTLLSTLLYYCASIKSGFTNGLQGLQMYAIFILKAPAHNPMFGSEY